MHIPELLSATGPTSLSPTRGYRPAPLDAAEPRPVEAAPMPPGRRVLIVEDDLDLRRIIAAFLEDESFEIDAAGSGVDALRSIERNPPSCIVLDVFLPVMTGWELADELKRRGLAIPIVVITAARDARHWAERIGAVSYVPKPISLPSLVRRVDEICA